MIGDMVRKILGIKVIDTTELRRKAREGRQLTRMARSERTDKLFETLIAEVRK